MFCCRRTALDKHLVDAAVEAGAERREGFSMRKLLRNDAGAVCGVSFCLSGTIDVWRWQLTPAHFPGARCHTDVGTAV